jgi:hypothetical protein
LEDLIALVEADELQVIEDGQLKRGKYRPKKSARTETPSPMAVQWGCSDFAGPMPRDNCPLDWDLPRGNIPFLGAWLIAYYRIGLAILRWRDRNIPQDI